MSLLGTWSDEDLKLSQIEIEYRLSYGDLEDHLVISNIDVPIRQIELLEIRVDTPGPIDILSIGFKNRNIPIKDGQYASRTKISMSNLGAGTYAQQYLIPPILYRSSGKGKKDSCSEFRMNIRDGNTDLVATLVYMRLRITRFGLSGTEMNMQHEAQIMMV